MPDNYDQFKRHEAKRQAELDKLPKCSECGEPIQSETCYEIDGGLVCEDCLENNHKKFVEDLIE
jgi:formylmethanofuran dehydrogenase subunit E